ncbi:MAG: ATP-dependent helicase, partial [Muribaculaceae bacterium]|nr:ATP-dependent helicase [Muribaculaceae bacterium]
YDDFLQKVAVGLKKNPDAAEFITGGYDHILIDEMQDTNPLQYLLLESFWTRCNLFCVGDDAQSIYGFRGADFNSIHYFQLLVPDSQVKRLTINYRTTQEILDLSNWVLERSPLNYNKRLSSHRGPGEKPVIIHYHQEWDMSRDIVMRIKDSLGEENCPFSENMILSRSNRGLKSVEACLVEAKIPYKIYGGTSLMASAHVRDIVSALRVVSNPRDELAWERYLCLFPRIGEITAARIIDKLLDKDSLEECVEVINGEKGIDPDLTATLINIKMLEIEVNRAVEAAMRGLSRILANKYKDDWERRRKDIGLLERIGRNSESLSTFISEYILDPSLGTGIKNESDPEDCVILTTIHSAKGLEARNCYLVNVNYTQYPSTRAVALGEDAVEEDRRCLYVALTRAKDRLILYRSHKAAQVIDPSDFDSFEASKMYFLNDLPDELYDVEHLRSGSKDWGLYLGEGISLTDCEEFDFS